MCIDLGQWRSLAAIRTAWIVLILWAVPTGRGGGPVALGHPHEHEPNDLHFTHPLVAESPSPDTKVRFDYRFENLANGAGEMHFLSFEAEYAFGRQLSIHAEAPYVFLDHHGDEDDRLGDTIIEAKYANFTFAEHGLLLGGGLEAGLPTGDDGCGIGSDHGFEIAPFLDFGYRRDRFEVIGIAEFGIPANRHGHEEADYEFGWNLALLYHAAPSLVPLVELDGKSLLGGEEGGFAPIYATPGVIVYPWAEHPNLMMGAGVSLPLTADREFHVRSILAVFYHF